LKPASVQTKQERIAELARSQPERAIYTLHHHIDYEWVRYAYECTRKDGATGVDGQTAAEYAANLERNLLSLIDRIKSGRYYAPAVRRHYIPKRDGGERGLGIGCFEDKVAQRAIVMLLEPLYEQVFLDCSYGFRAQRNAHQALREAWLAVMKRGGRWVLDVDIRKFFDSLVPGQLRAFLDRRVTDGVVRRMIDKWLKAGVLEEGQMHYPETGTPQGGVITPRTQKVTLAGRTPFGSARRGRATAGRRRRCNRDAMPDDDRVLADQDFFDDEAHDALAFEDIEGVGGAVQSREERREGFCQA